MSVDIKLDGLDQLRNRLKSFANPAPIVKVALEKSGEHLRGAIQELTPVRKGPSGGALKAAIVKGKVINGKIQIGPSQQGPAFRAHFLEFGTSKMPARPFIRPAFEQEKLTIEKIMAEEIRKGLKL
ncbi:MAG: HK97 gp10 family phage protein [Paenisporosarcina sp.]|nr:HK97 gp10 family phage protein [Paenisporosarcina sp.]